MKAFADAHPQLAEGLRLRCDPTFVRPGTDTAIHDATRLPIEVARLAAAYTPASEPLAAPDSHPEKDEFGGNRDEHDGNDGSGASGGRSDALPAAAATGVYPAAADGQTGADAAAAQTAVGGKRKEGAGAAGGTGDTSAAANNAGGSDDRGSKRARTS